MKKTFKLLLTILPIVLIIALITQASSQNQAKTLDYFNLIPSDEPILTIEGEAVPITAIYEKEKLFVGADDMMAILGLQGQYDEERNIYIINNEDFYKRKVYEAKNPSTGEKVIFLPITDLLKFVNLRYTISELGTYPTIRIQTSTFAVPTPTPAVAAATPAPGDGNGDAEGTPTPSPEQVYSEKCSKCHTLNKINSYSYSNADLQIIVNRMQTKEPGWISSEESAIILQHLIQLPH